MIHNFLEKHFNKSLSEEERELILKDFPNQMLMQSLPRNWAVTRSNSSKSRGRTLTSVPKRPFTTCRNSCLMSLALLPVYGQTSLTRRLSPVTPESVLLLIQRALVLLGSASHSISVECRKLVWAKMNPKLRSLGSEEYSTRGTDLFGPGFLQKASKIFEVEKTLFKVTKPHPPNTRRGRYENDKLDLLSFFNPRALRFSTGTHSIAAPNRTLSAGSKEEEDTNIIMESPIKGQRGKEAELAGQIVQPVSDSSPQTLLQTKIFGTTLVHIPQLESVPQILPGELEMYNLGPMDLAGGDGIPLGVNHRTATRRAT